MLLSNNYLTLIIINRATAVDKFLSIEVDILGMLSELLSSKTKSRLVNTFLSHPARSFSATELRVLTHCPQKQLVSTVKELFKMEFLLSTEKHRKKYYQINKHFALYPELVSMLRKLKKTPPDMLARAAEKAGECKFVALTGVFAGKPRAETDAIFVGRVSPARLKNFLKLAEKFAEQEVNYTIFTLPEFEYRKIMSDRFVKNILENNPCVVVDKTKNRSIAKLVYKL